MTNPDINSFEFENGITLAELPLYNYTLAKKLIRDWQHAQPTKRLIIVNNIFEVEKVSEELKFYLGDRFRIKRFLPWDTLPFDSVSPSIAISASRLDTLYSILQNEVDIVITSVEAITQKIVCHDELKKSINNFNELQNIDRDDILQILVTSGYRITNLVEEIGQVAVRGSVIDFYPEHIKYPIRIELKGSIIYSIRTFDTQSQRSLDNLKNIIVLPVKELFSERISKETLNSLVRYTEEQHLPLSSAKVIEESLRNSLLYPGLEFYLPFWQSLTSLYTYLNKEWEIISKSKDELSSSYVKYFNLILERKAIAIENGRLTADIKDLYLDEQEFSCEYFSSSCSPQISSEIRRPLAIKAKIVTNKHKENPLSALFEAIQDYLKKGFKVILVCDEDTRIKKLVNLITNYNLKSRICSTDFVTLKESLINVKENNEILIFKGELDTGIEDLESKLLLLSEKDIFASTIAKRKIGKSSSIRKFIGSISQLKENDYIVHIEHGVGIYRGLKEIVVDGKIGDFLHLEYADQAKLFLPVENISKLQKYAGANAKSPSLTKLGNKSWQITKARVKENVAELAGQLMKLIAKRELAKAIPLEFNDSELEEFSSKFPYQETNDQLKAINDVYQDLKKGKPMDRLVCGDVGYGKTEVAIRAAFNIACSGLQVAILVPTTILADQHYQNFKERFSDTAFQVACVSRFNSTAENKENLQRLSEGKVDIIIGTHRLLQKDVFFKNLGLVVIDEEHRFGVAHKEKLKRLRAEVNILTLTATPIPRTLHMSLVGIRDLSVIETAPINRQVTRTYIAPYSDTIVREAILRELSRNGQVFYIYNRVDNISLIADQLRTLVPEARIAFAHGQMKDRQLEDIMHNFVNKEIDVLVSTTIVESGLDIPNANTIIIRNSDKFGLAELYQLRGRVGRSSRRAYAYLLIPDPNSLSRDARKRLEVLQSLDDLGIGFRLALQDMEIRGAGNLLGKDQSGHIDLVGFELYSRILKEAVDELRRNSNKQIDTDNLALDIDPEVNIGFPAHIPKWYIPDVGERLVLYQRLIDLKDEQDANYTFEEIVDRFGTPPEEVVILLELMSLRTILKQNGVTSIKYSRGNLSFNFHPDIYLDSEKMLLIIKDKSKKLKISPHMSFSLRFDEADIKRPSDFTKELLPIFRFLFEK
ncbi:MAG: transcription-repair coupling factor [Proteobacteria bacterium]|nr:transcription-repair coupling factor [Pseudomonadota bacterium]